VPESGELDLAADYSIPLAMKVISGMIGIPDADWARFRIWSDVILRISYSRSGGPEAEKTIADFREFSAEMAGYLAGMIEERRGDTGSDLLARLVAAEVDGERLTPRDILAFFQLLTVAGQETTANLINNAVLCLTENPDQLTRIRSSPELLTGAIEETLRYRSPVQWMMRTPRHDVEVHGHTIPAGKLALCMIGSANRDTRQVADTDRFDIARNPNPHTWYSFLSGCRAFTDGSAHRPH
jgi:cytochrome P450